MNHETRITNHGFTLVELLLYVALIGIVILASSTLWSMLETQRLKAQTIREVNDQGVMAMQLMTQIVRNATAINSPTAGNSGTTISVNVPTGSLSPTVFSVSSGVLTMTEGSNPAVALSSSRIQVSSVSFSNLSRSGTLGSVRMAFSTNAIAPNLYQYLYDRTFVGSATIR